jgi:hypothetical protein
MGFLKTLSIFAIILFMSAQVSFAHAGSPRSKFYDFRDQLIDGEIKKPTTLYTDAREKVKFERLLRLKKSFMNELFDTAKERIFK